LIFILEVFAKKGLEAIDNLLPLDERISSMILKISWIAQLDK